MIQNSYQFGPENQCFLYPYILKAKIFKWCPLWGRIAVIHTNRLAWVSYLVLHFTCFLVGLCVRSIFRYFSYLVPCSALSFPNRWECPGSHQPGIISLIGLSVPTRWKYLGSVTSSPTVNSQHTNLGQYNLMFLFMN